MLQGREVVLIFRTVMPATDIHTSLVHWTFQGLVSKKQEARRDVHVWRVTEKSRAGGGRGGGRGA